MSDAPALEFRNVSFSYESAPVLGGFSLAIPAGGVTGIIGPNGCGKSTLLKLADVLLEPSCGEVFAAGKPVNALPARERARLVALLPQVHRTPAMIVRDLVMCGRYAHMGVFGRPGAEDEQAVDAALEEVGIASFAGKMARRLSGGERQRAFLAMAVAQDARILLLDEPTTYLDVRAAHETMHLVRELSERRGTSVVAVIHDLDLALRSCDRIVVLGGRRRGGPGRSARRGRAWRHRRRVRRRRLRGGDAPRSRLRLLPEGNGRIREGLRIRAAPPPHGLSWTGRVAPAMSFHPGWRMAAERGTL